MRFLIASLLIGAAATTSPSQQVLQQTKLESNSWTQPLHNLKESLESLSAEARAIWDEVSALFPEAMENASLLTPPKKHTQRPDSEWDHIIKGADVQNVWIENENGGKEREIHGKLDAYNLRAKKVNTTTLGVDSDVKQYSGYLDDEEQDKHLFYCKYLVSNEESTGLR